MVTDVQDINSAIRESSAWVSILRNEIGKSIVGQRYMIDRMIIGLLTGGHVLLEGVPGLGKTLAIKSMAAAINGSFQRIQFTPDMLPADVIGTQIYSQKTGDFHTKRGPIFANIVLADEINRAPAKVQSALLEGMQELQVTIGGETNRLPDLFIVFATENPIEHEGTYPLPESQVDRFLLKLKIEYPTKIEEMKILDEAGKIHREFAMEPVVSIDEILESRRMIDEIFIDEKVQEYIVDIVFATRKPSEYKINIDNFIQIGASPRATIALSLAAKAWAFLQGRGYVTPQDVKTIGIDVLRHRIITTYLAEAEDMNSEIIAARILNTIRVP
ncbi:MAG: MoxR family ATPase [Puniceicoccales bacterium]|jgi:MoxR-like ATPase|nr:MoxR family ATPase [Puniceicoccales bacterium]